MKKTTMMYLASAITIAALAVIFLPTLVMSHCQIPCGIYDDPARITRLYEDATTIEKAITQINELTGKTDAQSSNQLVRWVTNKEEHASYIITTIAEYFLAQRVKPVAKGSDGYGDYLTSVAAHHAVIVAAMKAKQHADQQYVADLRAAIDVIAEYYPDGHEH
jgi:nickel superoxide dismutase